MAEGTCQRIFGLGLLAPRASGSLNHYKITSLWIGEDEWVAKNIIELKYNRQAFLFGNVDIATGSHTTK